MSIIFNNEEVEEFIFNDVDCEKVYMNGVLVFEKSSAEVNMLTIGSWWGGYQDERDDAWGCRDLNNEEYPEDQIGDLVPPIIDGVEVDSFYWFEDRSSHTAYTGYIHSKERYQWTPEDKYRITIAGITLQTLGTAGYGDWDIRFGFDSPEEFHSLPKSGTVPVIVERVS